MYAFANGNPISLTDPFGLGAVGENSTWSWISSLPGAAVQKVWNVAYTGQLNPSPDVYNAATDAAGDYVYDSGGVRGFYGGVGVNGKQPGSGSVAGQAGLTGTWTIDSGFGAEIDLGAGLQERGHNGMAFTSQTVGVGGSYQFYDQSAGLQLPNSDNVQFPAIYGGTANKVGGANFVIPMNASSSTAIGINYGPVYGGLLIDPSKVWGNFVDSYHIITGTSSSGP
jgi:hypothetical protein